MRLTKLLILSSLLLTGCNSKAAPDPGAQNGADAASTTTSNKPTAIDSNSLSESAKQKSSYSLNDLDSIMPKPIETDADAEICLDAAKKTSDEILELTGAPDTSRTERLTDCVVQYDGDGSYLKYYPDGKRVRLFFRSSGVADVNIFAPAIETAIAQFRFDETTIIISGQDSDPIGQLMMTRSDKTKPFSRIGDWSKVSEPDRLENLALALYKDFAAISH